MQKTGKRKLNQLVTAKTLDGSLLRKATKLKSDGSILLQIQVKECVAIEVKYHKQCICYEKSTSFLRHQKDEGTSASSGIASKSSYLYEKSFRIFCRQFVQTEIIQNEGIFYMKKMKDVFVNLVKEEENVDASNYKTSRLERRMQMKFLQLVFHATKRRNRSEIIFSDSMKGSDVIEDMACVDMSSTDSDTDHDVDEAKLKAAASGVKLKDVYEVSLALRMTLEKSRMQGKV